MASTTLEITLISAKDLEDVNLFSDMVVYAYVSIDGDSRTAQRTTADQNGGTNPSWNATVRVPVLADDPSRHVVHVILRTERALGDRDVGEVHIPLKEFFSCSGDANNPRFISYQVRKPPSWNPRGVLNLSFKISDAIASAPVPPVAYPTETTYPPSASKAGCYSPATSYPSSGYPPYAQPGHGYPQGYPPYAQPGHGYPQGYPPYAHKSRTRVPSRILHCRRCLRRATAAVPHPQGYGYGVVPAPYVYPQAILTVRTTRIRVPTAAASGGLRLRRCPTTAAPEQASACVSLPPWSATP
ncbi:hypothetical protein J5N97_018223 [Dioscorea zingiberensis]|uniref:C2 domain-containing protein n=1 Tax=Dioscorea zingiberensis TaxID=325984 RepID=A0A9D5CMG7_9LILI|nr:hypothetical protein J5N97_018223 [Dioscorea zingiberensis]